MASKKQPRKLAVILPPDCPGSRDHLTLTSFFISETILACFIVWKLSWRHELQGAYLTGRQGPTLPPRFFGRDEMLFMSRAIRRAFTATALLGSFAMFHPAIAGSADPSCAAHNAT